MKPYPRYKPSGVPWLGDVPAHWEVKRIRFMARMNPRATRKLDPAERVSFLPMEAVGDDGSLKLEQTRPVDEVSAGYTYFEDGDVTVAKITPCFENGKGANMQGLTGGVGFGTTELIVIRPSKAVHPQWLYLLTQTTLFRKRGEALMQGAGGQKRVPDSYIKDFPVALPSDGEQFAIAAYLDAETARIDILVSEKEKLIELLREYQQSVITEAITKGLHPDAPMKQSGVPWLGDVPEHWDVVPLKSVTNGIQTGPFGSLLHAEDYIEGGVPIINPTNIQNGSIVADWSCTVSPEDAERLSRYQMAAGDIVFGRRGELGRCALVSEFESGWMCGTGALLVRPMQSVVTPAYLVRALSERGVREQLQLAAVGTTMENLNESILASVRLPKPPPTEQADIVTYLDTQTTKIDDLIVHVQQEIELLKELRSATITDAVLGRIDLRDYTKKNKQGDKASELQPAL